MLRLKHNALGDAIVHLLANALFDIGASQFLAEIQPQIDRRRHPSGRNDFSGINDSLVYDGCAQWLQVLERTPMRGRSLAFQESRSPQE